MFSKLQKDDVSIGILSGGKSSRMGGHDKGLLDFYGKSVLLRIVNLASNFSSDVFVVANSNLDKYNKIHPYVYTDILDDFQGPLSGIYTAMSKCKNKNLIILPCDGPFIIKEYFETLTTNKSNKDIQVIKTGNRLQPVYARINVSLLGNLENFLQSGERKIDKWYNSCGFDEICYEEDAEMFVNINSEDDIAKNQQLIKKIYG
tara:strand:+ start:2028 stop:2636 length:609 start_codon:yes stop_codon:yes gene_type:complete